jgi:hypothetical protein
VSILECEFTHEAFLWLFPHDYKFARTVYLSNNLLDCFFLEEAHSFENMGVDSKHFVTLYAVERRQQATIGSRLSYSKKTSVCQKVKSERSSKLWLPSTSATILAKAFVDLS